MKSNVRQGLASAARKALGCTVLVLELLSVAPLAGQEVRVRVGPMELELPADSVPDPSAASQPVEAHEGRLHLRPGGDEILSGTIRVLNLRGVVGTPGSSATIERVDGLEVELEEVTGEFELFGGILSFLPQTRLRDRQREAWLEKALDPTDLEIRWHGLPAAPDAGTIELVGLVQLTGLILHLAGAAEPLETRLCGPARLAHDLAASTIEPLELDLRPCDGDVGRGQLPSFDRWTLGDLALEARAVGQPTDKPPEQPTAEGLRLQRGAGDDHLSVRFDDFTFTGGLVKETSGYRLAGSWPEDEVSLERLNLALPLPGAGQPLALAGARPTALEAGGARWTLQAGGVLLGTGTGVLDLSADQGEGGSPGTLHLADFVADFLPAAFERPVPTEMRVRFPAAGTGLSADLSFAAWRLGDAELRPLRHPGLDSRKRLEPSLPELRLTLEEEDSRLRLALGKPGQSVSLQLGPAGSSTGTMVDVSFEAVLCKTESEAPVAFCLEQDALQLIFNRRRITSRLAAAEIRVPASELVFTNRQPVPLGDGRAVALTATVDGATSLEKAALQIDDELQLVIEGPLVSTEPVELRFDLGQGTPAAGPPPVAIAAGRFESEAPRFVARWPHRLRVAQRELDLHSLTAGKIIVEAHQATIEDLRLDLREAESATALVAEELTLPVDEAGIRLVQELPRLAARGSNPPPLPLQADSERAALVAPEAARLKRLAVPAYGLFASPEVLRKAVSKWFLRTATVLGPSGRERSLVYTPGVELGEQRLTIRARFYIPSSIPTKVSRLEVAVTVELAARLSGESLVFTPHIEALELLSTDYGLQSSIEDSQVVEDSLEIFKQALEHELARQPLELSLDFRPRAVLEEESLPRKAPEGQPAVHVLLLGPDGLHLLAGDEGADPATGAAAEPTFAEFAARFAEKRRDLLPALEPGPGAQLVLAPAYFESVAAAVLEGWTGRFSKSVAESGGRFSIMDPEVLACRDRRATDRAQAELEQNVEDCVRACSSRCRSRKDCSFHCTAFDVGCQARRSSCERKEDVWRAHCLRECESTCRREQQGPSGGTAGRCAALPGSLESRTASAELRFNLTFDYELRDLELAQQPAAPGPTSDLFRLHAAVLDEAPGHFEISRPAVELGDGLICATGSGASRESLFSPVAAPRPLYHLDWQEGLLFLKAAGRLELGQVFAPAAPPRWTVELSCQAPDGLSATARVVLELVEPDLAELLKLPVALPVLRLEPPDLVIDGTEHELVATEKGMFVLAR